MHVYEYIGADIRSCPLTRDLSPFTSIIFKKKKRKKKLCNSCVHDECVTIRVQQRGPKLLGHRFCDCQVCGK